MDEERVMGGGERDGGAGTEGATEAAGDEPAKLPGHVAASLCYLLSFASGVVFLVLEPDDRSIRFHAFQSILLGVVMMILEVGILLLKWIPPFGFLVGDLLQWVVGFAWVVITLILMIKAFGGEDYQLPYLGPRAAKLARPYE